MKTTLAALLLGTTLHCAIAQSERFVTLTAGPGPGPVATTNQVSIATTETAQVVDFVTTPFNGSPKYTVIKDGISFSWDSTPRVGPTFVKGPAQVVLTAGFNQTAMLTLKILPDTYDVNKTIILPPGTNKVSVALESSTNLVNWGTATNGVYGSPDEARFFRIKLSTP